MLLSGVSEKSLRPRRRSRVSGRWQFRCRSVKTTLMSAKRKSWREKLADSKGFPRVSPIDSTKSKRWGAGTFVIAAPMEVDELMRRVPKGRLTTIDELRKALAHRHGATIACPITTGIFAWIAAHAAGEPEGE